MTVRLAAAAFLCASALVGVNGCNIMGPVLFIAAGPEKVKARYELPQGKSVVILVDDRSSKLPRRSLRNVLATEAEQTLIESGAVKQQEMISGRAAQQVIHSERLSKPKSIAQIGRDVGADIVVYVSIENWFLTRDGVSYKPTSSFSIKVIDAESNTRLWPGMDEKGFSMEVGMPMRAVDVPKSASEVAQAHQGLATVIGTQLARLFFTHEKDQLSGALDD